MSYKIFYSHLLLGRKVHHRWRNLVGGINKAAEWYRRRLENGSEGPRMDGGHVHSAEARERQRARLPLAVHWAPIGRAREPIRGDGLLPSRHCYKCTNPVYTPVIIGPEREIGEIRPCLAVMIDLTTVNKLRDSLYSILSQLIFYTIGCGFTQILSLHILRSPSILFKCSDIHWKIYQ